MVFFYSLVPEIYSIDLLLISIYMYLCLKNKIYLILPFIAIVMGIRQSSGFLLIPSLLYIYYSHFKNNKIELKKLILSILAFILISFSWIIPTVNNVGGLELYLKYNSFLSEIIMSFSIKIRIIKFISFNLPFIVSIFILLIFSKVKKDIKNNLNIFLILIIIPQILIFAFYHYNKGYFLFAIPPIIILINRLLKLNYKVFLTVIILNISYFFLYPTEKVSYQIQMSSQNREMSNFEYWQSNYNYYWNSSFSLIQLNVNLHNDINENKSEIKKILEYKNLIINRSSLIRYHNISLFFPENNVIERTYFTEYSYEKRKNYIEYEEANDIRNLIGNSLILIDKDYYKKYQKDNSKILYETQYYFLIEVLDNKKIDFLNKDTKNFTSF